MVCRSITSSMSYFRCLSLRLRIETDTLEFSELGTNFEEAQAFRASTLDRIRMYLALECTVPDRDTDAHADETSSLDLEYFAPVGRAMVKHYTLGKWMSHNHGGGSVANASSNRAA